MTTRHAFGVGVRGGALGVLLVLSPLPASAKLIFVKAGATGAGDGTSWADAYTSLRNPLSFAQSGDEVWVAAGTYRPAKAGRTISFTIKPGVIVRGGFAGSETALGERDLAAVGRETILSGDLNGDDGPDFANYGDNSYHVLQSTIGGFESTPGIIDGFVITGGNADGSVMTINDIGGGIAVRAGGVICQNCLFLKNKAVNGGALSVRPSSIASRVELVDCTLLANAASGEGGAVWSPVGAVTMTRCRLLGNSATGSGGGLANAGEAVLSNCLFSGNTARLGAGAANLTSGTLTIRSSTLSGNTSGELGGGLYHAGDGACVVTSSIFWGNTSSCGATATQIDSDKDPVPIVHDSCVQGGWTAASGEANIDADPAFLDCDGADDRPGTVDDNPRLWGYSPAIDAGDGAVPEETLDLDRNPRHFDAVATADTGKGVAPVIDMGAFEYQGDCNGNGRPDAQDTALGGSKDSDQDGIPDECVAPPLRNLDCNSNDMVDSEDLWPSLVFAESQSLDLASRPLAIAAGDFNKDGDLDLAAAGLDPAGISVLLRDGQGKLSPLGGGALPAAGATSMVAADLDADDNADLTVAVPFGVVFFWSRGDGTFTPLETLPLGSNPVVVEAADLDRDGDLDLATANMLDSGSTDNASVLLNEGGRVFASPRNHGVGSGLALLAVADFDGDADNDLAVANLGTRDISLLRNSGDGSFAMAVKSRLPAGAGALTSAHPGEKDGAELIVMSSGIGCSGIAHFLGSTADGSFVATGSLRLPVQPGFVGAGDFGGDGGMGLMAAGADAAAVVAKDGLGHWTRFVPLEGTSLPGAFGDWSGDGRLDLALGANGKVSIYVNETPPARSRDTDRNGLPDECESRPFHRGDPNADGRTDLSDAVAILEFLFLGGVTPGCTESADVQNDGLVDLTDAVSILNYLFVNGPRPAPPGAPGFACDFDPDSTGSPMDLGCGVYELCQ